MFSFYINFIFCSCLTTAPHFKKALESTTSVRKPLTNHNPLTGSTITDAGLVKPGATPTAGLFIDKMQSSEGMYCTTLITTTYTSKGVAVVDFRLFFIGSEDWHLDSLVTQILSCLASCPSSKSPSHYGKHQSPSCRLGLGLPIFKLIMFPPIICATLLCPLCLKSYCTIQILLVSLSL